VTPYQWTDADNDEFWAIVTPTWRDERRPQSGSVFVGVLIGLAFVAPFWWGVARAIGWWLG
jgi:hypothetical protein